MLLLVTVGYCCFEVFIHKLTGNQVLNEQIPLIVMGGMVLILMILITTRYF
jgi:membrane protein